MLETVGKGANDIQLKVSSEKFKLASTLPAKHIYSVVDPYRGKNELSTHILPYVVKASKKEKSPFDITLDVKKHSTCVFGRTIVNIAFDCLTNYLSANHGTGVFCRILTQ